MGALTILGVAAIVGLAAGQTDGDLSFVVADGKRVGLKIGDKEIKFQDVGNFGNTDYSDASLAAVQMGYSLALPAMCKIPSLEVREELIQLEHDIKTWINHTESSIGGKISDVEAQLEDVSEMATREVSEALSTMDTKLAQAKADNEKYVEDELKKVTVNLTNALNQQSSTVDAKVSPLSGTKKQMDAIAAHPQWKWLAKPDDIKADNALKTAEAACADNPNCIQTATGYGGRRFFKIRFNPNRPGYFTEGFVELSQGCHDLNEYLKVNAKPYGLDRKLKPVCDHSSVSMASGCTYLPYSFFSQCISNHHYGHGLQQSMCQNGIFYNNGWWNGWSMLWNCGSGCHTWGYMRNQNTNHQFTLCTSDVLSGDDMYWKN